MRLDSVTPFSPEFRGPYNAIGTTDHLWIRMRFRVFIPEDHPDATPCAVMMIAGQHGDYAYHSRCLEDLPLGSWQEVEVDYLTPHMRHQSDDIKAHIWHRGKHPVWIDDLTMEAWVPE